MGTHIIPRDVKGEERILLFFTPKGFMYSLIGLGVGTLFFTIFSALGATMVGVIILVLFALIGLVLGQFKLPDSNALDILKKAGGEYTDEIIVRYFKFRKNRKIYLYDEGRKKK